MERNDRTAFLEAELLLNQVMTHEYRADPQIGGRALAALAYLEEKKGTIDSMRLAAGYYRELGRDFAKEAVRVRTGEVLTRDGDPTRSGLPQARDRVASITRQGRRAG